MRAEEGVKKHIAMTLSLVLLVGTHASGGYTS